MVRMLFVWINESSAFEGKWNNGRDTDNMRCRQLKMMQEDYFTTYKKRWRQEYSAEMNERNSETQDYSEHICLSTHIVAISCKSKP
jgi:hypothetical protein